MIEPRFYIKDEKNNSENTLIVLGAGASIGAKASPKNTWIDSMKMPSSQQFFYDLFVLGDVSKGSERKVNSLALMYENVNQFLVQSWGLQKNVNSFNPNEWKKINIEDVFTFLDTGEKMLKRGTNYHLAFSKSKELLEDFIRISLNTRCYERHCEYLAHIFSCLKSQDNIISFNWDTFADYSLMRLDIPQYKNYLHLMSGEKIQIRDFAKKGVLLKLHGSLNWIICQNKACKAFNRPQLPLMKNSNKLLPFTSKHADICNVCGNKTDKHFIVPPVSNKLIHKNSFLHQLWLLAREKISCTRHIIFIGYSFPPTDFYSEWLFRQIYFLTGQQPEIVVVNPDIDKKNSIVYKRYRDIFKRRQLITYKTLEDFAQAVQETEASLDFKKIVP